jgi:N-acetylglucosaminyldiphosphoundecaprenol N-acetyl-beta-D-mannosaminyltransferase
MHEIETNTYLGLKFSVFDLSVLLNRIKELINKDIQTVVYGYSLTLLPKFREFPELFTYSNRFDLFLTDGRGMFILLKLLKFQLKSEISIPRFAEHLLNLANHNQYRVLLFGSKENVNKKATEKIRIKYPEAIICQGINGYFNKEEEEKIVEKINSLAPDILFIGISSPIKEKFVIDWRNELNAKIILPCGGLIDALAGETSIAPILIKKLGLAWFYRFLQEPRRLFKPLFINGLIVLFYLVPVILLQYYIKGNKKFSIPSYYNIKSSE